MAKCIPDRLPASASQGEIRLFKILANLPEDCLVYYEPLIENRFADFVIVMPTIGLMVIEVKGWRPSDVLGGDLENVLVRNRGQEQRQRHPIRQAREYMLSLMRTCEKHQAFRHLLHRDGKYKGRFVLPFGYFSILSNITCTQAEESGITILFPKDKVMTRDGLLEWEDQTSDTSRSLAQLKSYFDPWWPIATLNDTQVDTLRAIIHPEVILFSFMDPSRQWKDEAVKVLDIRAREPCPQHRHRTSHHLWSSRFRQDRHFGSSC